MKDCKKRGCFICKGNHHSSLHEERSINDRGSVTAFTPSEECILPLLPFEGRGEEVWGVLDTGSSKNYVCRKAIERCNLKPIQWETTRLRTAEGIGKASKRPVYALSTYNQKGERFEFEAMGLDQCNFAETERAPSKDLKSKYDHLRGLYIPESKDGKYEVQMLIGDPTFTEIRTGECKKGLGGQPIADETLFGWAVHGERGEMNINDFTQTTSSEYEQLYRLDVLGVEDRREFDQEEVKKEFIENIEQREDGRYKIKIPWIEERVPQNTNESQSRLRPNWIQDKEKWPKTEENPETDIECIQEELKKGETLFYCAENKANLKEIDSLLERKTLKGTKRIIAWCLRFSLNCRANRSGEKRKAGPLTTEEIENADKKLIRNAQEQVNLESKEAQQLGLNKCEDEVMFW